MTNKNVSSPSNVIDLNQRRLQRINHATAESAFEDLASKLETRIKNIESNLQDSLSLLDHDIKKLVRKNAGETIISDFKNEFENFSRLLEDRINTSLKNLQTQSEKKLPDKEYKIIKHLTSQLLNTLSFEFYKNIMAQANSPEKKEVDEFGMDQEFVNKVKPLFDFLYYKYWRVETTGTNHIPNQGRALLVGNHSGTVPYDGAMIACAVVNEHAVRKDVRFLVEDFVYHMPILGSFMYRIGGIRACPENAERLLNKDHLAIVFPEGVKGIGKYYKQRYQLQRFGRGGFIKLCIQTKSPLIPVSVIGAEEIHPIVFKSNILAKTIGVPYIPITPTFPLLGIFGMMPMPTKWHIHFGKPIAMEQYSKKTLDDEIQIHKLSEKVREEIQKNLFDLLKRRSSLWLG